MTRTLRRLAFILLPCFLFSACKKDLIEPKEATQVPVPATHDINAIRFVNDTLGFMAGGDKYTAAEILTTKDGGKTWARFYQNAQDSKAVYGLGYNGHQMFAVGYDGKFYSPENNYDSWSIKRAGNWEEWMQSIVFTGANKGFVISGEGYRGGRLYATDSLGNIALLDTFEFQLVDIRFADTQTGYLSGYGAILKTADGGGSWQLQDVKGDLFRSIYCVDQDQVWAVGYNGTIVHTSDGGAHWERQRNGDNPLLKKYRFRAVAFKDIHVGYAAGDKGLIVKTTDGGAHWSEFKNLTDKDIKCMTIHPDGSLWLAGTDGVVFHIRD